ncbi:hypothetical protein KKP91_04215 [Methanothermococcus sp. SCGC AD-155-M21]|nr:hypothetical protein [Methanothermococcus sp. SCGC AD-155-M21]
MVVLPYRKPCLRGRLEPKGNLNELILVINGLLAHKMNISIVPSGNAGLYIASHVLNTLKPSSNNSRNNILIPDMGGWRGFIEYPKIFNFNIIKLQSDLGIINPNTLDDVLKKNNIQALFLTTLAGYLAHQPIKEIKKICEEREVILVEDVSGGIGGTCGYGDIVVCSMGSPKIINCEYGGFIGINDKVKEYLIENKKIDEFKGLLKTYKVFNIYGLMKEEALDAKKTYNKLIKYSNIFKEEFENSYFIDNNGVCVFLEYKNQKEIFDRINKTLKLDNGKSLITKCPIYERILKNGIVIELKKMDILNISQGEIFEIMKEIKKIDKSQKK